MRSGDAVAADLVRSFHADAQVPALPLSTEQLVVARRETLLALGADPSIPDARFGGTALDWALHFDQAATADLLDGR